MSDVSPALPAYMAALAPVIADVVAPAAAEVDRTGAGGVVSPSGARRCGGSPDRANAQSVLSDFASD